MLTRVSSLLKMKPPVSTNNGLLFASGITVPSDGATGYQTGCIFQHTDGAAESALYVNEGSVTSADFNAIGSPSTLEIADLSDVGATAYTAGSILVGDGDSYEEVAVSGDATLASTGALTIATGAVEDSMIEGLAAGAFIIGVDGTAANNAKVTMSGDATMAATGAVTIVDGVTAPTVTAEHAAGVIGTGVAPVTKRWQENGTIITETKIDLTGLHSTATGDDVIGLEAGGIAYIGKNDVSKNGIIYKAELICIELPAGAGADTDINVVANASATLEEDGAGGTAYGVDGGAQAAGQVVEDLVQGLTANHYFYLTAGTGSAGTYTAGQLIFRTHGHALLA